MSSGTEVMSVALHRLHQTLVAVVSAGAIACAAASAVGGFYPFALDPFAPNAIALWCNSHWALTTAVGTGCVAALLLLARFSSSRAAEIACAVFLVGELAVHLARPGIQDFTLLHDNWPHILVVSIGPGITLLAGVAAAAFLTDRSWVGVPLIAYILLGTVFGLRPLPNPYAAAYQEVVQELIDQVVVQAPAGSPFVQAPPEIIRYSLYLVASFVAMLSPRRPRW